jgi:phage-related protein
MEAVYALCPLEPIIPHGLWAIKALGASCAVTILYEGGRFCMSFANVFEVNAFTFGGITSSQKRLIVGAKKVYNGPIRSVEQMAIPGLAGDLLLDNSRHENIMVEYDCYVQPASSETLAQTCRYIKNWLYFIGAGQNGYKYLTDTYDPDYRREAVYLGEYDLEQWAHEIGYVPVVFNCKPYKTRINPATITFNAAGSLTNPETFDAYPKYTGKREWRGRVECGELNHHDQQHRRIHRHKLRNEVCL